MKIELRDDGVSAVIVVIASVLNVSNVKGALEVIKLVSDVDIRSLGWFRRTVLISGEREEVLKAARILQRHTGEPVRQMS